MNQQEQERRERGGLEGTLWEEAVFERSNRGLPQPEYLVWKDALFDAVAKQAHMDWNPCKPKTPTAREIFECVQSYLPADLAERLGFFCAIGTAFDYWHGVDGFFLIDGKRCIVSVDLVYRVNSKLNKKADFLFSRDDMGIGLWRLCKAVATTLQENL